MMAHMMTPLFPQGDNGGHMPFRVRGREREVSNGSERTKRGRKRQRVRGCIKTIRDAWLRWQPWSASGRRAGGEMKGRIVV